MNFVFAGLITLIIYPFSGTFLYALVEQLKISIKLKVFIVTFIHPLVGATIIWTICSTFNRDIAETGVLFMAGAFFRIPFSKKKYLANLLKESEAVTVEYVTELLRLRTIRIASSEITDFNQSKSIRLIDKPSGLTINLLEETLTFEILDKRQVVF